MNTCIDCIPCIFRQALDGARRISDDPALHERVLREVAGWIQTADLAEPPPVMAWRLHRLLVQLTGIENPYAEAKHRDNALALGLLPELRDRLAASPDPFRLAVRLAIAGNQIDLGPKSTMSADEVLDAVRRVEEQPFVGDVAAFEKRVRSATTVLYLADNAGEIVVDRLLIEAIGPAKTTAVVRGAPIINDATLADAKEAGLTDLCTVIPNGAAIPGTVVERCSSEVQHAFADADLVISKGQGNYETLSDAPREIFFLMKVKCPVIAARTGHPVGTQVLMKNS